MKRFLKNWSVMTCVISRGVARMRRTMASLLRGGGAGVTTSFFGGCEISIGSATSSTTTVRGMAQISMYLRTLGIGA